VAKKKANAENSTSELEKLVAELEKRALRSYYRGLRQIGRPPKKEKGKTFFSLMDFVKGFLEYSLTHKVKSFPPSNSRPWHEFLYALKKKLPKKHYFTQYIGDFDWDDPFPKNRNLDQVMFGLHYLGYFRLTDGRFVTNPKAIKLVIANMRENAIFQDYKKGWHKQLMELSKTAYTVAAKIPDFFEY